MEKAQSQLHSTLRVAATFLNTSAQSFSNEILVVRTNTLDLTSAMDSGTFQRGTLAATVFCWESFRGIRKEFTEIGHI